MQMAWISSKHDYKRQALDDMDKTWLFVKALLYSFIWVEELFRKDTMEEAIRDHCNKSLLQFFGFKKPFEAKKRKSQREDLLMFF